MNETAQNIGNTNTLADLLAEKLSLRKNDTKELTEITNRYPYFGFAQFLLAKKLSAVGDADASKHLQQCALYFSNPFWLHYLLSEDEITDNVPFDELAFDTTIQAEITPEQSQERTEEENETYSESSQTLIVGTPAAVNDIIEQPQEQYEEESKNNIEASATPFETLKQPEVGLEQSQQKIEETNTFEIGEASVIKNETEERNFELTESITDAVGEVVKKNQKNKIEESKEESVIETKTEEGDDDAEREKLSKLIEQHLSEFKKPLEGNEEIPLTSRVYHAIDYFASQGIKLDPRLISEDKLGSKVKKFTDWLKQMKRVNENPTDLGTDTETEQLIEKIAQTSNEAKDVITETMAQVLVKQGKIEKAIQLYQKLSFLNTSKTTYFAAKINELKGIR